MFSVSEWVKSKHAWSMAVFRGEYFHFTVRAAFDDSGDGVTVFFRDLESCGESMCSDIKTVRAHTGGGKRELSCWY